MKVVRKNKNKQLARTVGKNCNVKVRRKNKLIALTLGAAGLDLVNKLDSGITCIDI